MAQDYRENVLLALDTLRSHKLRSFLTVLGVVIGVGVIIVVGALLTGFNQSVVEEITGFGADTAFISKFSAIGPGRLTKEERMRKELTLADGEAILELSPAVKAAAVSIFPPFPTHRVSYKGTEVVGLDFRGTFPSFAQVYANAVMKDGRFFTESENLHRQNIVVIGENVATALFPNVDAVGKEVLVDKTPYQVIGVFKKPKGGFGGNDEDRRVVIPYYTFRKTYPNAINHGIRIEAYPGKLDLAVDQAREVLRRRRNVGYNEPDNFAIQTSQQIVDQFHQIIGGVALAMVVLSSIGLLIGGVGVMNIMLVSVTERTREIGIRKAIGARSRDITWQFLLEAMTLTGMGGLLECLSLEASRF